MTSGHRRAHLWLWIVIAPLAVLAVILAVLLRPAQPVQEGMAPGSSQDGGTSVFRAGEIQR